LAGETKRLRLERGVSLHRLSAITGYSRPHVREVERADARVPSATVVAAVDRALSAGGRLSVLRARACGELQRRREEEREQALEAPTVIDAASCPDPAPTFTELAVTLLGGATYSEANDMHRRTLILGLGGTALGLEAARHGLTLATAEERAEVAIDEWEEIIAEYGQSYQTSAPAELLDRLMVDVIGVQYAMSRVPSDATLRELRRVAGFLATFMTMTVANLGDLRESRRWWRTAKRAIDASGDVAASIWVRGREVVRAVYEQRPNATILQQIEEAEALAVNPPAGSPLEFVSGKAQALAIMGRGDEAERALEDFRKVLSGAPAMTTNDKESLFGWPEERLRFTESLVYSHLGQYDKADAAQRRAVALYPASYPRGPAQIELQRALCLVACGDVATGAEHALNAMSALPTEHHVRPVVDLGHKVFQAIPYSEHRRPSVARFGEYLALPSNTRSEPRRLSSS
jgi:tetratricopeptide (TPR) repeat protein